MKNVMKVSSADYTDMTNAVDNFSVAEAETDEAEIEYVPEWEKWLGYYKTIPELQAEIDKKSMWSIGKGYECDEKTRKILERIRGNGKDDFNSIIYNQDRTKTIGGDSYAEIVRSKRAELRNLKPLNPSCVKTKTNSAGMIVKYILTVQDSKGMKKEIPFDPEEIFHLSQNKLGSDCHGISTIEKIENIILMKNEAMADMKIVFHRYVKPLIIVKAATDDPAEIAALKVKLDKAVQLGENMIVPLDSMEMDRMAIPQYATLDPLPWINRLQEYFIIAEGVPEVILGYGKDTTEASAKILYLAFQQVVEFNQLYLETQIRLQLGINLEFNFPENIAPEMKTDIRKERNMNNYNSNNKIEAKPEAVKK